MAGLSYTRSSVASFWLDTAVAAGGVVDGEPEHAVNAAANPAATDWRQRGTSLMHRTDGVFLRNDGELRGLHLEGFELTGATLRIFCRHRIPHDPHRRIVGHHPFSDPEFPFRLPFVLSIAHRDIDRLASVGEVNDELRRAVALAGSWIERVHPEPDRLAALELIVQETVADVARGIEVDDVAKEDQPIGAGLTRKRRWGERRDQDERRALAQVFHALTVTESRWSVQPKDVSARTAVASGAGYFRYQWPSKLGIE
jgi:hypothetical protein